MRAWAVSPSARAMRAVAGPSARSDASSMLTTLVALRKSCTPSGEAKRAVPEVGMTWLGPAV